MKTLIPVKVARNVLIPGWIVTFGLILLIDPPTNVPTSLSLVFVGLFIVPAIMLMSRVLQPAPAPKS